MLPIFTLNYVRNGFTLIDGVFCENLCPESPLTVEQFFGFLKLIFIFSQLFKDQHLFYVRFICYIFLNPIDYSILLVQYLYDWHAFSRPHGPLAPSHRRSQDFCLGATRPTPPNHASVMHTFEAVAGSWGSVSAPAVRRIMGGATEQNKNTKKIWVKWHLWEGFCKCCQPQIHWCGM